MNLLSLRGVADRGFFFMQQFRFESKYFKLQVTIIEINQLTVHFPIHIQIL